jgi:hypothetical protein
MDHPHACKRVLGEESLSISRHPGIKINEARKKPLCTNLSAHTTTTAASHDTHRHLDRSAEQDTHTQLTTRGPIH